MNIAKLSSALFALASTSTVFAHESPLPHAHPHTFSPATSTVLILTLLIGAALVYGGRKLKRSSTKNL